MVEMRLSIEYWDGSTLIDPEALSSLFNWDEREEDDNPIRSVLPIEETCFSIDCAFSYASFRVVGFFSFNMKLKVALKESM